MTSPLVYIEKQYNFLESALPVQDSKIVSAARLMRSPTYTSRVCTTRYYMYTTST